MMKTRILSIVTLLLMAATGAWAQDETLLTTITATAQEQASYSTANVATVSFSYTAGGSSAYHATYGWWGYGWSATVNAAEGYTITKCIFYDDKNRTATDSEAPFVVETTEEDKTPKVNGTPILAYQSAGIKKIEVYGYTYSVTLAEGTEDFDKWTISPAEGLEGGETVTATYNGAKKVKSVKAKKKAPAGPTSYTLAESTVGMVVGTNGLAYAVADKDNLPTGVTVAGLVAYKNGDNGLAIALTDEPNTMDWYDAMGNSGAKAHTPAVTGQTWKLPSSDDIVNMLSNYDSYWPDLNEAIANVGGTGLLGGTEDIYWLSDESDELEDEARYMRELSDEPRTASKGETYLVRSVIAF